MDTFTLHIKKNEKIKHIHLNVKNTHFMCLTKEDNLFLILKCQNNDNVIDKELIRIIPFHNYFVTFPFNELTFYCMNQHRNQDILIHFEQEL